MEYDAIKCGENDLDYFSYLRPLVQLRKFFGNSKYNFFETDQVHRTDVCGTVVAVETSGTAKTML